MSDKAKGRAPSHLTEAEKVIWGALAVEFDTARPSVCGLLEVAAVQLAASRRAKEQVEREGQMISINGGRTDVAHPLIRVAREASSLAARALKELRREVELEARKAPQPARPLGAGRPGRPRGSGKSPRVTGGR